MSTRKPKAVQTSGSQSPLSVGSSRRCFHDLSVARTLSSTIEVQVPSLPESPLIFSFGSGGLD